MELRPTNKPYHSDHSIVYSGQYHVIFCPKYRRKVLGDAVSQRLKELIWAKQAEYGYTVMGMQIMPDHVHLLQDVDPRIGIHTIVGQIKGYTSHEVRPEFPWLERRVPTWWTRSQFISTVGAVTLAVVPAYMEN